MPFTPPGSQNQAESLLGQATEPMQHSQVLIALMASLDAVPVLALAVAAVLAIAASSSIAVVLLAVSLAASGTVTPTLGAPHWCLAPISEVRFRQSLRRPTTGLWRSG